MKIVINEKMIRRNARIGQVMGAAGLLVLAGGMYISIKMPTQIAFSWGALVLGFTLAQVGIYFGNRWGRRPRMDEALSQALKGLDNRYTLYHYSTPAGHLLVGPAGVWVLIPLYQRGVITYEKGHWRQKGGGIGLTYLKMFAQEGLGNPDVEVATRVGGIKQDLEKKMTAVQVPPIQVALVFTNEQAVLQVDDAPIPAVAAKKLKDLIRKAAKNDPLSLTKLEAIQNTLGQGKEMAGE